MIYRGSYLLNFTESPLTYYVVGCPTEKVEVYKTIPSQYFYPRQDRNHTAIGEILEKVCENAILNHRRKYQKWYMTKIMYTRATA